MIPSLARLVRSCARAVLPSIVMLFFAHSASASPSLAEKATAQALFEDALQLMGAKRYAEACPKLEESERLDPALGTRFRLSECEEAVGRLASAWAGFLEVADLAHAAGQAERETVARARAATIEPKLSRVKVDVTKPDTPGLEVAHDHEIVGRGQWGTPVPIDPGTYTITATAPGKKPWRGSVTIEGDAATASLTVPALDDAPAEVLPAPVVAAPIAAPVTKKVTGTSGAKIAGWTLVGVGGAAIASSVVMGLVAKGNYDGASGNCGPSSCNAAGKATIDSARSLASGATVVFVAGAVAAAAGVVVVIVAPTRSRPEVALRVGPGSLGLEGSF